MIIQVLGLEWVTCLKTHYWKPHGLSVCLTVPVQVPYHLIVLFDSGSAGLLFHYLSHNIGRPNLAVARDMYGRKKAL